MKKKVNRNFLWSEIFVAHLAYYGVKYACISPGSRNAPLSYALAANKKIKCFVNIDERSSAFFALGLARSSNTPVVVVTTSGTATAELYPAIIEAFQQRTPLIICTADRPRELRNSGANQMINQKYIYRNHIGWFKDVGLPELSENKIANLKFITQKAITFASTQSKGPVHLNFPFSKPLEPGSFTDEVELNRINSLTLIKFKNSTLQKPLNKKVSKIITKIAEKIALAKRGLIIAGPEEFHAIIITAVNSLSKATGFPVLADGASQLRYGVENKFILSNHDSFLRSDNFRQKFIPDLVLQFGRTATSSMLDDYFKEIDTERFLINEYGERFAPSGMVKTILKYKPEIFCNAVIEQLNAISYKKIENDWSSVFQKADNLSEHIKSKTILNSAFPCEPRIIPEVLKALPSNCSLMIANSLPIRDLDCFAGSSKNRLKIYFNRGASGIDGITSTAFGIAEHNKTSVLITGDLSFLHDVNALLIAKNYAISLVIILINNNGGGIFESLPIRNHKKLFKEFFKTPHNQNIKNIVEAFGADHILIEGWDHLRESLAYSMKKKSPAVLEIKTNSVSSHKLRKKYHNLVKEKINSEFS